MKERHGKRNRTRSPEGHPATASRRSGKENTGTVLTSCVFIFFLLFSVGCRTDGEAGGGRSIGWDDDGMLVIDGRRIFLLGSYHLPAGEAPFAQLEREGYNYVKVPPVRALLDKAAAHHLRTWVVTGSLHGGTAAADSSRIVALLDTLASHPALLCWETEDEPAFTWRADTPRIAPEPLIRTYRLLKRIDPLHPVYTNHAPLNLVTTLRLYNPATDIVACDIYPILPRGIRPQYALNDDGRHGDLLNCYPSQVGEYVDKMKRVGEGKKPVFMVLQAFAWEMLRPPADRDTSMVLYPTYRQSRYMAWDAIVHGANGILYWGRAYTPPGTPFLSDLARVTRELASLQAILTERDEEINFHITYHETGHSVDAGVEMILKKHGKLYYLITVNSDKNPLRVTLNGMEEFRRARVLTENRSLTIRDGALTDTYKPFDVHIYELEK